MCHFKGEINPFLFIAQEVLEQDPEPFGKKNVTAFYFSLVPSSLTPNQ